MNFFSTDAFLRPLAEVAFKGRRTDIRCFSLGGARYRMLEVDGVPLAQFPFMDFLEPAGEALPDDPTVRWIPFAANGKLDAAEYRPSPNAQPAPTVELSRFADVEALWKHVHALNGRLAADDRRVRRKLAEQLGDLEIRIHDERKEAYQQALRWKSAQYRATGLVDMFEDPVHRALFDALHAAGTLQVSSLSAGGLLVAVHLGMRDGKRFCSWIPAYDHAFSRYSPGRQLLHALLEDCLKRGDAEFDFLIGEERYKWDYATSVRCVREAGEAPLSVRTKATLKRGLKAALGAAGLLEVAKAAKKQLA